MTHSHDRLKAEPNYTGEDQVAQKSNSKRKEYTKDDVKQLKAHSKARTPVANSASCAAPIRQDCIEASAKSEVVTVCSWQFAGEERLQSTAMILIATGDPHRCDGHLPG